jgi:hypothetical protein
VAGAVTLDVAGMVLVPACSSCEASLRTMTPDDPDTSFGGAAPSTYCSAKRGPMGRISSRARTYEMCLWAVCTCNSFRLLTRLNRDPVLSMPSAYGTEARGVQERLIVKLGRCVRPESERARKTGMRVNIWCDGSAMPNGGPAGAGYVIVGDIRMLGSDPLGKATNNTAEYTAVRTVCGPLQTGAQRGRTSEWTRQSCTTSSQAARSARPTI